MAKISIGLEENIAGLLCYVLGWISGIVFLLLERENRFVRFHAVQSIVVFGGLTVAEAVLSWIPYIGPFLSWISGILGFVVWIVLMVKAYQGTRYKIPWAGNIAERWAG